METLNQLWDALVWQLTNTEVTLTNSVVRLVLAMVLGAVVGFERKQKGQVAGVRTFALISMGACMAMLLSIYVPQVYFGLKNGDPGRIAAQVVTGVGFLGGGAMIQQKGSIRGLTTAAGIWMVATIGMAVGVGMYGASVLATILIMITLIVFEHIEHARRLGLELKALNVTVEGEVTDLSDYRRCFKECGIHLSNYFIECRYERHESEISFVILSPHGTDYLAIFARIRAIRPTRTIRLSSEVEV